MNQEETGVHFTGHVDLEKATADPMSEWFKSAEIHPRYVGAYECRTVVFNAAQERVGVDTAHYRWFNGHQWSYPIESDLDEEFASPPADQYPLLQEEILPFLWRGFKEDPDPL